MRMRGTVRWISEILVALLGVLFVMPVFFLFMNSMKSQPEMFESFLALPKGINFENYVMAWNNMHYARAFGNTLFVTVVGVTLITLLTAMAAYRIGKNKSKWATVLLMYFVLSMMLPFHTIMIPLMQVATTLNVAGSLFGYSVVAAALYCPFPIYLYRGFYKQIPNDIEEAARIDGASAIQAFFRVVLPLLQPITATIVIINVMGIWNDYVLAMLLLQRQTRMTLQVSVMQYNSRYNFQWHLTLATLAIVILPVIVFYICMQNRIQSGLISGSLKG
jgi:raffinose/stachyose/melibiose transport system permease protein